MPRERTGAERYFAERMDDPEYRFHFETARRRTGQFDKIIRQIEQRRNEIGWSYTELAVHANVDPQDIQLIYSLDQPDPPFSTVVALADAVGLELEARLRSDVPLDSAQVS